MIGRDSSSITLRAAWIPNHGICFSFCRFCLDLWAEFSWFVISQRTRSAHLGTSVSAHLKHQLWPLSKCMLWSHAKMVVHMEFTNANDSFHQNKIQSIFIIRIFECKITDCLQKRFVISVIRYCSLLIHHCKNHFEMFGDSLLCFWERFNAFYMFIQK